MDYDGGMKLFACLSRFAFRGVLLSACCAAVLLPVAAQEAPAAPKKAPSAAARQATARALAARQANPISAGPVDAILMESYAAEVNGKVITVSDVLNAMQPAIARLSRETPAHRLKAALQEEYNQTRATIVDNELILMEFNQVGGQLPARAIEDHINGVLQERFGGDRAALLRALAAERLTMEEWRTQMMEQLIVQVMRQREVLAKIVVTPFDLQMEYDQRKASFSHPAQVHIRMLTLPQGQTPAEVEKNRALAQRIRDRIADGVAPFAEAARLLSNEPNAAANHGDAGWHDVASLAPGVAKAIKALKKGGLSEVLDLPPNFYLVQLEDRKAASVDAFEDVAGQLERELRRKEYEKLEKLWLNELRSKYYIRLYAHDIFP